MMEQLTGSTLLFTDIHFGIKQNAVSRLNICINAVKQILKSIKVHDVKNVVFAGDLFHERVSVNVNTLNVALKCIQAIAKHCKTYLIVGNHDAHFKNSVDVNSLNMFRDTANVYVIDKPTEVQINGKSALLCPWLSDLQAFSKESYDYMIGHFDISSKFLISQYIDDNASMTAVQKSVADQIQNDNLLTSEAKSHSLSKDSVGDFVDYTKRNGTIFAGHIHTNQEFVSKGRKFIFIGSPYEQTRGDIGNACGWYILDEKCHLEHVPSEGLPKHVDLKMSDVLAAGVDKFDFACVKNSILHKVYDCEVSQLDDSKITQKIVDYKPYDELIPEYAVVLSKTDVKDETFELIKKSKLEYIRNYIDNIDKAVLDEQNIDPNRLYSLLEEHYQKVVEHR